MLLAGGTALAQAVVIGFAPLLTRLYTPADFGALAVFVALVSSLAPIASLRYQLAIPLPESEAVARDLLVLAVAIPFGLAAIVAGLITVGGRTLSHLLNAAALRSYLWLLPLSLLGAGVYSAVSYWAIRRRAFRALAITKLSQTSATTATQVFLGGVAMGPGGLVLGDAIGRVMAGGHLLVATLRADRALLRQVSVSGIIAAARRYSRFPAFSTASSLINSFGSNLPTLALGAFYGPQVLGWFALSQRLLGVSTTLVGQAVGQVYNSHAAELARTDPRALLVLFRQTALRLFVVGLAPTVLTLIAGPWVFQFVFGSHWRFAGVYSQILAIAFLIQFISVPLSATIDVLEMQRLQLVWDAARLALIGGGVLIAGYLGAPAVVAIGTFSCMLFATYIVYLLIMDRAILRAARLHDS